MIQWGVNLCVTTSLKALLGCNLAMVETDFRSEMRRISSPALIIHGNADQSAPIALIGQKSAELIAGTQFKVYESASHGLFITHMDRLNKDLLTFLSS
jgi:non-heme chloroperoxidase